MWLACQPAFLSFSPQNFLFAFFSLFIFFLSLDYDALFICEWIGFYSWIFTSRHLTIATPQSNTGQYDAAQMIWWWLLFLLVIHYTYIKALNSWVRVYRYFTIVGSNNNCNNSQTAFMRNILTLGVLNIDNNNPPFRQIYSGHRDITNRQHIEINWNAQTKLKKNIAWTIHKTECERNRTRAKEQNIGFYLLNLCAV